MDRAEALAIVRQYTKNENLVRHMLAVEAAMRYYAEMYSENADLWGAAGLLHDFDYEMHPTLEKHPMDGIPYLREHDVSEELIRAVLSHADYTGVTRESRMEKALFACDEITGLITAVALVRPSKSIHDVKIKSIKKKWKDKAFAAGVNREDVIEGAEAFGVELWEHIGHVLAAMQGIAADLGLEGIPT